MSEDIFFNGEKLPPLREGKVWGFRMYMGGRMIVKQCDPETLITADKVVWVFRDGDLYATVWLDDAELLLNLRIAYMGERK